MDCIARPRGKALSRRPECGFAVGHGTLRLISSPSRKICRSRPMGWVCKRDGALPSKEGGKVYNVTVHGRKNEVHHIQVPEDRYIWWEMEKQGVDLPASCRNGCCTTCAVRVTSGDVEQEEALGLSREMRKQGYALLCVSYPRSDVICELQDEDEVYVKQFGDTFESGGVEWGGVMADLEEE